MDNTTKISTFSQTISDEKLKILCQTTLKKLSIGWRNNGKKKGHESVRGREKEKRGGYGF